MDFGEIVELRRLRCTGGCEMSAMCARFFRGGHNMEFCEVSWGEVDDEGDDKDGEDGEW